MLPTSGRTWRRSEVPHPEQQELRCCFLEPERDIGHVDLVCEVGDVALSNVNVIEVVLPSSFFVVNVVVARLRSASKDHI